MRNKISFEIEEIDNGWLLSNNQTGTKYYNSFEEIQKQVPELLEEFRKTELEIEG